jgi:uncharacterized membrane protein
MTGRTQLVLTALAIAVVTHLAVVAFLPRMIMTYVMGRMVTVTGINRLYHPPLPDAARRDIVRPCPDLAYSVCVFDLSQGPVRLTTPDSPTYLSVSGFSAQTDNFFAINDRAITDEGLVLWLVAAKPSQPPRAGEPFVVSPTPRGVVLIRRVVQSPEHFARVDDARRRARCEVVTDG